MLLPPEAQEPLYVMRDVMDYQLLSSDDIRIGRVADVRAEWCDDGELYLTHLVTGPQALAGRVNEHLRPLARLIFRDRFEHAIPLDDVVAFGPSIRLKRKAVEYGTGQSDRWIARHILRWIPGSGIPWTHSAGTSPSKTSSEAGS
jgi:hypothetical protein